MVFSSEKDEERIDTLQPIIAKLGSQAENAMSKNALADQLCSACQKLTMLEKSCLVCDCIWAENDNFCNVLAQATIPLDSKWPLLILYLRGIRDIKSLSEVQKTRMQELLLSILREKDFSQTRYDEMQTAVLSIITLSYQERVNQFVRETAQLAKDMNNMFGKHQREVATIVDNVDTELAKGSDPALLLAGIRDVLKDVVAKMEQDADTLVSLSHKDSLTGFANRRFFDTFLDECVERWKTRREPVSLIMFDIDHFKKFNDTYGHLVGDQVLRTLAIPVQNVLAPLKGDSSNILVARYGGEEFCILLSGRLSERSVQIGENLRKAIQNTALLLRDINGKVIASGLNVTVSVGIADINPEWEAAFQANLVDCADKALYCAKSGGRNRTVHYTPNAPEVYSLIAAG